MMKYIKPFNEINLDNVNNYDWEYFFQEFIDDFNIDIIDQPGIHNTHFFKFSLYGVIISTLDIYGFHYDSQRLSEYNSNLDDLGDLQPLFVNLIKRINVMNGGIVISKSDEYEFIDSISVYITINTFKNFIKNESLPN